MLPSATPISAATETGIAVEKLIHPFLRIKPSGGPNAEEKGRLVYFTQLQKRGFVLARAQFFSMLPRPPFVSYVYYHYSQIWVLASPAFSLVRSIHPLKYYSMEAFAY